MLGLASARLARALSIDEVSAPLRDRVKEAGDAPGAPAWQRWAARLIGCPICTGWWISLAVSLVAPGRRRLLRGTAVAGAQVLLALAERLVSEEGRAAIHHADLAEAAVPRRRSA